MDKAREAQDGPAKGESEDTSGAGNTESPVETPMDVSDTAKEGSDKPSSKSKLKSILLYYHLSRRMGKPTICIGENKGADQLRGNREADHRLCFRYSDITIPLLSKSKISSL